MVQRLLRQPPCPAQKGRSKRRAVQWLFAADRQFHGMRFQVGSVSALASWHDCRRERNSETVSCAGPTQDARRHQILFFFAFIFENPYIYRKQLHLVLAVPGSLLTREEAESFMDLLAATVRKTRHSA